MLPLARVLRASYRAIDGCQVVHPSNCPQKAGGVVARYVSHSLSVCKPVALKTGASHVLLQLQS